MNGQRTETEESTCLKTRIRRARRRFAAIATSYFLGVFNDNFYKQAALLVAASQQRYLMQTLATGLLSACYMLAAAPAGWMADRYPKGRVIIAAKAVEVGAMAVGAWGIWTGNWFLVLAMTGVMGAQSAVFSPAMNGSIPELYPSEYVRTANAVVKVLTTTAIFFGMALAGWLVPSPSEAGGASVEASPTAAATGVIEFSQIPAVGWCALAAAVIGLLASFGAPMIPAAETKIRFPWAGPWDSIREFMAIGRDRVLAICVYGNIFLWSIAALITLLMDNLGLQYFRISPWATSMTKILFLVGIAIGGALSTVFAKGPRFFRIFIPTFYVMGIILVLLPPLALILPAHVATWVVFGMLGLFGVFGGTLLIPLESTIQIRPLPERKGRVIAAANFAVFFGITISAGVLYALNKAMNPLFSLAVTGCFIFLFAFWLSRRLAKIKEEDLR
jgi:acyl-[acyl-carrier-protein]-phospholipid O-acyltransferase/long-chain-fatty-acid--[acyl-carrier-protein] ligase